MSTQSSMFRPRRYVRTPQPVVFPVEADVPESKRHLELRTALYLILKHALAHTAMIGSDQFVYWDPTDPRACLAPDAFVKMGRPDEDFDTWKIWERGAPDLAVELVSRSDAPEPAWTEKLGAYRKVGVQELVRFDHRASDTALRIWDNVEGDFVERVLETSEDARSTVIPFYWVVVNTDEGRMLRLSEDSDGMRLVPTPEERARFEAERAASEAARAQTEAARASSEAIRADTAEAELAILRGQLRRLQGE